MTDPVCQKQVAAWWSIVRRLYSDTEGHRFYFCSPDCKAKFDAHPAAFTGTEEFERADDDGMLEHRPPAADEL